MSKLLMSVKEAASALGLSVRTIHKYISLGILPHVRAGRRKLLRTEDLLKFAQRGVSVEALKNVQEHMKSNG